jgi:hypothetical protein
MTRDATSRRSARPCGLIQAIRFPEGLDQQVRVWCPPQAIHADIVKAGSTSSTRATASCAFLLEGIPRLPPGVARRFVDDIRAFHAEPNAIKRDEIAACQLHALRQHYTGKLKLSDARETFEQMRDHA